MAQVQTTNTSSVLPNVSGLPQVDVRTSPDTFGAGIGQAVSQAGQNAGQIAIAFQGLENETYAKQADINLTSAQLNILKNPQTGYFTKQGGDAVAAHDGTVQALNNAYISARAALPNDEARRMFDQSAVRSTQYSLESAASHADQQSLEWQKGTDLARIQSQINAGAAFWNDSNKFAQSVATIKGEVQSYGERTGQSPEQIANDQQHYTSEAWTQRIRSVMNTDPNSAQAMFQQNADQIDAAHQAVIGPQIDQHIYMAQTRAIAAQAHADAMAERNLREGQAINFGKLAGPAINGQGADVSTVARMVQTQQLTPEQGQFILNPDLGHRNDPATQLRMEYNVANGTATIADLTAAAPQLSPQTAGQLAAKIGNRDYEANSEATRGFHQQLNTVLGVGADGKPLFDLGGTENAARIQLQAQAQGEFTTRTAINHEDPQTVINDMMPRYDKMLSATPSSLSQLPLPRLGAVGSIDQVNQVATETVAAHDSGKMTDQAYQQEVGLLSRYRAFYLAEQQRQQAAKPVLQNTAKGSRVLSTDTPVMPGGQ